MPLTPEKRAILDQYYGATTAIPAVAKAPVRPSIQRDANDQTYGFMGPFISDAQTALERRGQGIIDLGVDYAPETTAKVFGTTPERLRTAMDKAIDANRASSEGRGFFESLPGTMLGDPLTFLPFMNGATTIPKMAMGGAGYGGLSGLLTPTKSNESRLANTLFQGGAGAVTAPAIGWPLQKAAGLAEDFAKWLGSKVGSGDAAEQIAAKANIASPDAEISNSVSINPGVSVDELQNAVANASQDAKKAFTYNASQNLTPDQAARIARFTKQGVPYTSGDITQNVSQQGLESMAAKGAYGTEAEALAKQFQTSQQQALTQAAQNTAASIGKSTGNAVNEADVAEAVQSGLRKAADDEWNAVSQAYNKVQKSGTAAFPVRAFRPLQEESLRLRAEYPVDALPKAKITLDKIDDFFERNSDKGAVNYKVVDNFRKFVNNAWSGSQDDAERAVLSQLRSKMDSIVDDSVEQGLIKGNPATIESLKSARGMAKDYFERFQDNKVIDSIIRKDMTPESVISMTIGYGKLGAKKEAASVINGIKDILGENSSEFLQLKQAGVYRILGTDFNALSKEGISGIQPAKNLDEIIRTNKSLWESLYTPEEQQAISEITQLVKDATVKQPGAVNYSNTTPALIRHMNTLMNNFGSMGNIVTSGVNKAINAAKNQQTTMALEKSLSGKVTLPTDQSSLGQALSTRLINRAAQGIGANAAQAPIATPISPAPGAGLTPEKRKILDEYFNQQNQSVKPALPPQSSITPEIQKAASISGVDAGLLHKIASVESGMNPNAGNPNSTAQGLFQITNATWRSLVKRYGKEHGITYKDRKNPQANAIMAALLARDNKASLTKRLGHAPTDGELYIAHFLGDYAASKLIKNKTSKNAAAALFPEAAKANRNVFYASGKPLTAAELYQKLTT